MYASFASKNVFWPPLQSDWFMCIPMPLSPKTGFGMNEATLPCRPGDRLQDEPDVLDVVGGRDEVVEPDVDLPLPGGRHLVVVGVHGDVEGVREDVAHLAPKPLEGVVRPGLVVPFLEPDRAVAVGRSDHGASLLSITVARAPPGVPDGVGPRQQLDGVEDEELDLGPPERAVVAGVGEDPGCVRRCRAGRGSTAPASPPSRMSQMNRAVPPCSAPHGMTPKVAGSGQQDHVRFVDLRGTPGPTNRPAWGSP